MSNLWLENGMQPGRHLLIDMGCVDERRVRRSADRLFKVVAPKGNAQIVGERRLVVRIPPSKKEIVLKRFKMVVEGAAEYCWCTHGWMRSLPQSRSKL